MNVFERMSRRAWCDACSRAASVCACAWVPPGGPIEHECALWIIVLQHPHERRHKLRTDWILEKCVANVHVLVSRAIRDRSHYVKNGQSNALSILEPLWQRPSSCALLYPSDTDSDQPQPGPESCRNENIQYLFAVDATWKYAKEIVRGSPALLSLKKISLTRELGARDGVFLVRKEPVSSYAVEGEHGEQRSAPLLLSTAEAVADAVDLLVDGKVERRSNAVRFVCEQVSRAQLTRASNFVHRTDRPGYQPDLYAHVIGRGSSALTEN